MIAVSALGIESARFRDRFEERGLAAAVLADEARHGALEREIDPAGKSANAERMPRGIDLVRQAGHTAEKRGLQASCAHRPLFHRHRTTMPRASEPGRQLRETAATHIRGSN